MKIITDAKIAYRWLREQAALPDSYLPVTATAFSIYEVADDRFEAGRPMTGLDIDLCLETVRSAPDYLPYAPTLVAVTEPVAMFAGMLGAELDYRGDDGSVSVEQAILMLICALEWKENFEHTPSTRTCAGTVKTRDQFQIEQQVSLSIVIPAAVGNGSQFSFRSRKLCINFGNFIES